MQGLSGIRATTADNLILDAGQAYFNIDLDALEGASADPFGDAILNAIPLGATRGGSTFNRGLTMREIEVDGRLGPVKGLNRRQEVRPTLTINFVEMTIENFKKSIAGATEAVVNEYTKITGGEVKDEDYIPNVALAATISREGEEGLPVVVVVENALVLQSSDLAFADRNETVAAVTFVGHFLVTSLTQEPWRIYIPNEQS